MGRFLPFLGALALTASCGQAPSEPSVTAENAVVTLPAVPGRPGAGYFTLRGNRAGIALTGIDSPRVGRIELHETMASGHMSGMRATPRVAVPEGAPLVFEPGGRHAMLYEIDPAVRVGDRLPLTLSFEGAPPATVEAEVHGPGHGHAGH